MGLEHLVGGLARFPPTRPLARSLHRRQFQRPFGDHNLYYGVYESYAAARSAAQALSTSTLPASYDIEAAGRIYRSHLDGIRVSDYPLVHWLSRLFAKGQARVFDLGGNIGVTYYAFQRYLEYPAELAWCVHDLPTVVAAGRKWAQGHDERHSLGFDESPRGASGHDVLVCTGALQYLEYTLPELLQSLPQPPPHVLINLTPVHEERGFFTLQNLSIAICPYRVMARRELIAGMNALGYEAIDQWRSFERRLDVPFEPECAIDHYSGGYFRRA